MTTNCRKVVVGAACLAAGLLGVSACGADPGTSGSPGKRALTIALNSPLSSLNPFLLRTSDDVTFDEALYDTLVRFGPNGSLLPNLASSWKVTPRSAEFTLRKGVTCSDGTVLTPAGVAASLNYEADPSSGAVGAYDAFGPGTAHATPESGNRVLVTLSKPWGTLLSGLAAPWNAIVCPAGLRHPKTLARVPAGTGPYTLVSSTPGVRYTLQRRPGYDWGAPFPGLGKGSLPEKLTFTIVSDPNTRLNLLRSGGADIASLPDGSVAQAPKNLASIPFTFGSFMFWFNEAPGKPTRSEAARIAISQAINRSTFNRDATAGHGQLVDSWGHPPMPCYDPSLTSLIPKYNPAAARSAHVTAPIHIIADDFLGTAGSDYVLAALKQAGFNATLANMDEATFDNQLGTGNGSWDIAMTPSGSIGNTMMLFGRTFLGPPPPKGLNIPHVTNPAFAAAFAKATTKTGTSACKDWSAAQRALVGRHDMLPLSTIGGRYYFQAGVTAEDPGGELDPSTLRTS